MKSNTLKKSSITLPPSELRIVKNLQKSLGAKSKVEVIRKGLELLQIQTDRDLLRQAFRDAVKKVASTSKLEIDELDSLSNENLNDDND